MVEFGAFRMDAADERLWKGQTRLTVRRKPFAILRYLVENPRRLVTHDELLQNVWGGSVVSESAVRTHLHELRQLLGEGLIETVIGRGYRFTGSVSTAGSTVAEPVRRASIIGRDAELASLRAMLDRARAGHRQLVFVTGDAGIGKTTLADGFLDEIDGAETIVARGQCVEQHGSPEAYLAVIEMLDGVRRSSHGDRAMETLVRYAPTFLAQVARLVPDNQLDEVRRRAAGATESRMVRELLEAIEAIASQVTLVVVLEDLQWSDVATLDLLSVLGQRRERAKLMVVATSRRAEAQTATHPLNRIMRPLTARNHAAAIALERIGHDDIAGLVDRRFSRHAFTAEFITAVDRCTAGIPLYVASLLDDLVERGMVTSSDGTWALAVSVAELAEHRPDSLRQLIDIQLDRLTPQEQRVLEAASTVGVEPAIALISAALEQDEELVDEVCDALARRGLFLRRAAAYELPDGTLWTRYAFAHALVADVCRERSAPTRRQRWHRLIAERLDAAHGAERSQIARLLATHYDQAHLGARAIELYIEAAERTARKFASPDALALFRRALELAMRTPPTKLRDATELRILQGMSTTILRSPSTDADPLALFHRMIELAQGLGDHQALASALINAGLRYGTIGEYQRMAELVERADQLGEMPAAIAELRDTARAVYKLWTGQLLEALEVLERLVAADVPFDDMQLGMLGPRDRRAVLITYISLVAWTVGFPDRARRVADEAFAMASALGDPFTLSLTRCNLARLRIMIGQGTEAVRGFAEPVLAIEPVTMWREQAVLLCAWADASEGRLDDTGAANIVKTFRSRIERFAMGTSHLGLPVVDALRRANRNDLALEVVDQILAAIDQRDERILEPEVRRLHGALVEGRDPAAAATAYRQAIELAHRIGARMLELRAACDLARIDPGAVERVRQVYATFTEGFDTPDLVEARRLLGA